MAVREINVIVAGEFVRKDSKNAGVQGEGNVTTLRLTLDKTWEGYAKRIIWRDAAGENPVAVILYTPVTKAVEAGGTPDPLTFETPIPSEPMAVPGWCSFTLEGYEPGAEGTPGRVAYSVTDRLEVRPNDGFYSPAEPTAGQALQLQAEIEGIMPQVTELVGGAVRDLEAARVWEPWDGDKTYVRENKVSRRGSSYLCVAPCQGVDPVLDVAESGGERGNFWIKIAAKGEQGDQGAAGRWTAWNSRRAGPPGRARAGRETGTAGLARPSWGPWTGWTQRPAGRGRAPGPTRRAGDQWGSGLHRRDGGLQRGRRRASPVRIYRRGTAELLHQRFGAPLPGHLRKGSVKVAYV